MRLAVRMKYAPIYCVKTITTHTHMYILSLLLHVTHSTTIYYEYSSVSQAAGGAGGLSI